MKASGLPPSQRHQVISQPQPDNQTAGSSNAEGVTSASKSNAPAAPPRKTTGRTVRGGPMVPTPSDPNIQQRFQLQQRGQAVASDGNLQVGQMVRTPSDDEINGNYENLMRSMPHNIKERLENPSPIGDRSPGATADSTAAKSQRPDPLHPSLSLRPTKT